MNFSADIQPSTTVDFPRMLRNLKAKGLSRNNIAMQANIQISSINHYEAGTMPLHPAGERLIDLWCSTMELPRDKVPMRLESIRSHFSPKDKSLTPA